MADSTTPYLRVVRGDATAEEIAALVATLEAVAVATAAAAAGEGPQRVLEWNNRSRLLRSPVHSSPGGWRRSALP
ncbi:MAG TPA: acyl-CoA carboxylase subunit epsilon [Trebonia sp.]|nr:acyl-CoA carboxylase subunit epsilon [Trebonia sp.]